MADLSQITDATERAKIIQNPSQAKPLQPPKPMFMFSGAFSGANEETQSFAAIDVVRSPAGLRELVAALGVRLKIQGVRDPSTGNSIDIDWMVEGTSDEWFGKLCQRVPLASERTDRIRQLEILKRDLSRNPQHRRQFIQWCQLRLTDEQT